MSKDNWHIDEVMLNVIMRHRKACPIKSDQYFSRRYKHTGTLWEGRYRSCLVQNEEYLMQLYRYIELNPVRAGMVEDPTNYSWSSYSCNDLGKESELRAPHQLYLALGTAKQERLDNYRALFKYHVQGKLLDDIRKATNKSLALGRQ